MRCTVRIFFSLVVAIACCFACAQGFAGAFWVHPGDPGVVTNNDCGFISSVSGAPLMRRSFMSTEESGQSVYVADRLQSGDELEVPDDSRLEWNSGKNVVVVLGPRSAVKLGGIRNFTAADGQAVMRLDVQLLRGELRVQVRKNTARPEAVLIEIAGADVLVEHGDVETRATGGWRAVVLDGQASARQRRNGVVGAPFLFTGVVGSDGVESVDAIEQAAVKRRLPFSFESMRAALPPIPVQGTMFEAP